MIDVDGARRHAIAARLGIDPITVRRRNLIGKAEMPYRLATVEPLAIETETDSGDVGFGDVVQNDVSTLAAQFQLSPLHRASRNLADPLACFRRPRERDHVDEGIRRQFLPHFAATHHDVEDTRWYAGLLTHAGEFQCIHRRPRMWFQDDGATDSQRW